MMAKRKSHLPAVGEWVIVCHGLVNPEYWWISPVLYSAPDGILVRCTQGHQADHHLYIASTDQILVTAPTREACLELYLAANRIKADHRQKINRAQKALDARKTRCVSEIEALAGSAAKKLYGDVEAIEP